MPVAIKLSREFYERFGDRIANEFVEVLNQVDLAYRDDLRELNEANFRRFEAKLEQRLAEFRGEVREELMKFQAGMRQEMAEFKLAMRSEMSALREENTRLRGDMNRGFERLRADMLKWMFVFWATSLLTMVGIVVAVLRRG